MANNYRNIISAKGLHSVWNGKDYNDIIPSVPEEYPNYVSEGDPTGMFGWRYKNWGCDGRLFFSDNSKENTLFLLTANATPWRVIKRISELLGDTDLYHEFSDQDNYNHTIYYLNWRNGHQRRSSKIRL